MTEVNTTAYTSQRQRVRPGGASTRTSPTAVTALATACPEGKDAPVVAMRDPGGRGRSMTAFMVPISTSLVRTASPNAASLSQCLRQASRTKARIRSGQLTHVLPNHERATATAVVGALRTAPANRHT